MTMPNFLVIGAAKSGTTSLYAYLSQHPQIYMSPVKETNFFAIEGKTLNYKYTASKVIDNYLAQCKTDLKSYQDLFQEVMDEKAIGEVSPMYLYDPKAPERIQNYIPDAKLIAILRNPVERAYSSFLHTIRENLEPITDFSQAIHEEEHRRRSNWWWGFFYVHPGFYCEQLQRYLERFKPSQLKIYLYEDLSDRPFDLLQDLFKFLEVSETFTPDISSRYNATGIPKNELLHNLLKSRIVHASLKRLPQQLRQRIINLNSQNLTKPPLDLAVRNQLIEIYREDILKLQVLLQRDLSHWLK